MGGCLSNPGDKLDIRTIADLKLLARTLAQRPGIARRPRRNRHGETLLHLAAYNGNPSAARLLLEAGADIEAADALGRRALHVAALSAHKACLLALLENKAAVDAQDAGGQTALALAAFQGNEACLRALLSAGASCAVADRGGWGPLHLAARSGHERCLAALLDAGADHEAPDAYGRTPAALAAAGGREACLRALLAAGAAVATRSSDGRTALHRAAGGGHEACVRALLESRADVGAVDSSGATPLHAASSFGAQPVIRCLAAAGADLAALDGAGRSAAQLAEAAGHPEAAQLLRSLQQEQQQQQGRRQVNGAAEANQAQPAEPHGPLTPDMTGSSGLAAAWQQAAQQAAAATAAPGAEPGAPAGGRAGAVAAAPRGGHSLSDSALEQRPAWPSAPTATRSLMAAIEASNGADGGSNGGAALPSPVAVAQQQQRNGAPGAADLLRPWELRFSDLTIERPIGQGSYGRVYLARLHETPCAVKVLLGWQEGEGGRPPERQALTLSSPLLADLHKEAGVMAALHHPNCVMLIGVCPDPAAIVTEYCPRGSLYDVLAAARRNPAAARQLTWARRLHLAMGAAQGMLHLATRTPPIVHRDLKSPNLLVDAAWRAKVCDLNLAKAAAGLSSQLSSAGALNPRWLAPEVLAGGGATLASDVFSYGIVLWELLTWRPPWAEVGGNPWQLAAAVIAGQRPEVPPREELPGPDTAQFGGLVAYISLMRRCWAADPAERPGFAEVVRQLRVLLNSAVQPGASSGSTGAGRGSSG